MSDALWPHGLQHARLPCPSPTPRACSNSCPLGRWCYPTISSPVILFSCFQSFPASGSFPMSQLFPSGGQSIGVSVLTSVLPMNIQNWLLIIREMQIKIWWHITSHWLEWQSSKNPQKTNTGEGVEKRESSCTAGSVRGVCNFRGSVSSQQKFEAMDRPVLQPSDRPVLQPSNGPVLQFHVIAQFFFLINVF